MSALVRVALRAGRVVTARESRRRRARDAALAQRLGLLVRTLTGRAPTGDSLVSLVAQAADAVASCGEDEVWLTLALVTAELPTAPDVQRLRRRGELEGPRAIVAGATAAMSDRRLNRKVHVATDEVLVDVNHLCQTTLLTGIQRVTHETVRRWHRDHRISLVRWSDDFLSLQRTDETETARVVAGPGAGAGSPARDQAPYAPGNVVVPWRSVFVLPEVALEIARTKRLQALAMHSRCKTSAIGFDTVPLTSGETTDTNVPGYFMHELAAIRHMDRVTTISGAAATEYRGWRTMISSLGVPGPEIEPISLPVVAPEPSAASLAATRDRYVLGGVPMVLCVGSHEPRKNHLAVLHAAELLWRRGVEFTLLFVGGNAWHSGRFQQRLAELTAEGRPVESALGVKDETLWALYRLAHCTVFPSLNEGFGLPVAESLASGTPAVTSNFGSMAEIAADGGALLVNPRDDHSVAGALHRLITDDLEHARLTREAAGRPRRSWDDYAEQTWTYLVARPD